MTKSQPPRRNILVVLAAVAAIWVIYTYQYRYSSRMVPLPLAWIDVIYAGERAAPAPQITFKGSIDFPDFG